MSCNEPKSYTLFELPIYRGSPERCNEKMEERKRKDIKQRAAMGLPPRRDYVLMVGDITRSLAGL